MEMTHCSLLFYWLFDISCKWKANDLCSHSSLCNRVLAFSFYRSSRVICLLITDYKELAGKPHRQAEQRNGHACLTWPACHTHHTPRRFELRFRMPWNALPHVSFQDISDEDVTNNVNRQADEWACSWCDATFASFFLLISVIARLRGGVSFFLQLSCV